MLVTPGCCSRVGRLIWNGEDASLSIVIGCWEAIAFLSFLKEGWEFVINPILIIPILI